MNTWYIIVGIALLAFGIWQTITIVKVFLNGKQDWLGADIKIFGSGIMAIIGGIIMILKNI
jgi:hypothetical protein